VLFVFKYFNFFTEGAQGVFDFIGLQLNLPTIQILLPLGLSFLIFQTSSYIIDVSRGMVLPEKSFINFATFVVYFPHMAAGPIMPSKILLPQISANKITLSPEKVESALFLIALGLFRKIVIADTLAPMVNRILGNPSLFDWKSILLASIGFGLQIYGDFAGYSSIARGVSRLFGIEMMQNFRQPYLSTSITEFWRRWHISLSSWFRDYLYIPLGGNRGKTYRKYSNLMIVMVVAGLWHGAALGFLVWGFLHGLFLIIDKSVNKKKSGNRLVVFATKPLGWVGTQVCVFFAWIFFRNPNLADAVNVIGSILNRSIGTFEISDALLVLFALAITISLDIVEALFSPKIKLLNPLLKGLLFGILIVIILTMRSSSVVPFIYFRF
jgi:D-alanyl-lipoteichoic acid acyltransferase DltB (MBOAT superfamily)